MSRDKNIFNIIENMLRKIQGNLWQFFGNNFSLNYKSGTSVILFLIIMISIIVYIFSGFYIVKPAEQGVITRFGKYNRTVTQGPHWIPMLIESKKVINTEKLERSSHGSSMLTKDENIVIVAIEVQYRINDVEKYLFNLVNPSLALKQAADSALRQVIGNSALDFIVTSGKEQIATNIHEQMQDILDSYDIGIYIAAVALKEAKVPNDVKVAFDDVIRAQEEREQLKHQAEAFANKIIPEAKGTAVQMIEESEAYQKETILRAEGDTAKFALLLSEYIKYPGITKTRLYLDSLEEVFFNSSKILINMGSENSILLLPLDKMLNFNNKDNINSDLLGNSIDTSVNTIYDKNIRRH